MKYTFEIAVTVDEKEIEFRGENWTKCFLESAQEFADELKAFIDGHPFVEGCKITQSKE